MVGDFDLMYLCFQGKKFNFFFSIKYKRFRLIKFLSFSENKAKGATEMPKFVMVSSRKPSLDVKGKIKIATFY